MERGPVAENQQGSDEGQQGRDGCGGRLGADDHRQQSRDHQPGRPRIVPYKRSCGRVIAGRPPDLPQPLTDDSAKRGRGP